MGFWWLPINQWGCHWREGVLLNCHRWGGSTTQLEWLHLLPPPSNLLFPPMLVDCIRPPNRLVLAPGPYVWHHSLNNCIAKMFGNLGFHWFLRWTFKYKHVAGRLMRKTFNIYDHLYCVALNWIAQASQFQQNLKALKGGPWLVFGWEVWGCYIESGNGKPSLSILHLENHMGLPSIGCDLMTLFITSTVLC